MKHIKLNGIWYRLAEGAEGQHYNLSYQPLRPPNSQLVQGESGKFQIRPDVLLWSWTDWSEGESQIKYDPNMPGRSYVIQNLEPFQKPGTIGQGYSAEIVTDSADASWSGATSLVIGINNLWAIKGSNIYPWDSGNDRFGAAEAMTSVTAVDPNSVVGDSDYLFVHEDGTNDIHRRDSAGTWTQHNNQCTLTGEVIMAELGAYVYIYVPTTGAVYEISKETANTSTTEVPILYVPDNPNLDADQKLVVVGDNRVYVATSDKQKTSIYEIIPTSAAGTGFGSEMSTIYGATPETLFYAGGTLFMIGYDRTPDGTTASDRQIFYIDPQGSYGTLGSVRGFTGTNGPSTIKPVAAGGRLAMSAFVLPATNDGSDSDDERINLFEIDQITGGYAAVGGDNGTLSATEQPISLVYYEGYYYMTNPTTMIRWDVDSTSTTESGVAQSPSNDFGLSGEKVLDTIEVEFDPLPASASVTVGYQLDGVGGYTDVLVSNTDGDTGGTIEISTDSTTKKFRSLKIALTLGGAARVRAVDVYARVNRRIRVWDLQIDASDDAAPQGLNGAKVISKLTGIAENTVVDFVDNYQSYVPDPSGLTSRDVIVDAINVSLSQQGEGVVQVRLLEVL